MVKVVIAWFVLDVVAVLMMLYDYKRWYGQDNKAFQDGVSQAETSRDSIPPHRA